MGARFTPWQQLMLMRLAAAPLPQVPGTAGSGLRGGGQHDCAQGGMGVRGDCLAGLIPDRCRVAARWNMAALKAGQGMIGQLCGVHRQGAWLRCLSHDLWLLSLCCCMRPSL